MHEEEKADKNEVVTAPLKWKKNQQTGKPRNAHHKTNTLDISGGLNADAQSGVSGTGGQVTIVVHSNVKGVIAQIKDKFSEYQKNIEAIVATDM